MRRWKFDKHDFLKNSSSRETRFPKTWIREKVDFSWTWFPENSISLINTIPRKTRFLEKLDFPKTRLPKKFDFPNKLDSSKNSIFENFDFPKNWVDFGIDKPSGNATSDVSVTCICESASQSSLFDKRTKVVFNENSSATGSETCWARIGNVKSTAALGLPKKHFYHAFDTDHSRNHRWLERFDGPKQSMIRKMMTCDFGIHFRLILGWVRLGFRSEMGLDQN